MAVQDVIRGGLEGLAASLQGYMAAKVAVAQAKNAQDKQRALLTFQQQKLDLEAELGRRGIDLQERQLEETSKQTTALREQNRLEAEKQRQFQLSLQREKIGADAEAREDTQAHDIELQNLKSDAEFKTAQAKISADLLKAAGGNITATLPEPYKSAFAFAVQGATNNDQVARNAQTLSNMINAGQLEQAKEFISSIAVNTADATELKGYVARQEMLQTIEAIDQALSQLAADGRVTGILTGASEQLTQKILRTTSDANLARFATELDLAIQRYRQLVSGAAFTEAEAAEYKRIFPSLSNVEELNTAKLQAIRDVNVRNQQLFLQRRLGEQGANLVGVRVDAAPLSTEAQNAQNALNAAGIIPPPQPQPKAQTDSTGFFGPPRALTDDAVQQIVEQLQHANISEGVIRATLKKRGATDEQVEQYLGGE